MTSEADHVRMRVLPRKFTVARGRDKEYDVARLSFPSHCLAVRGRMGDARLRLVTRLKFLPSGLLSMRLLTVW